MYENFMKVRTDSQRVTWSHPLTYLCLTNNYGAILSFGSAV